MPRPPHLIAFVLAVMAACGGTDGRSEPTSTEDHSGNPAASLTTAATEPGSTTPPTAPLEPTIAWVTGPDIGLSLPGGVAVSSSGDILVFDAGNSRLLKFSPDGELRDEWSDTGEAPGQFNSLGFGGVAVDGDDNIFVVDNGNFRVQKFNREGEFQLEFGTEGDGPGQFQRAIGIAVGADDRVYVTDDARPEVQVFDRDGSFVFSFGSPGTGPGEFSHPTGIAVDDRGHIYVADFENKTVQKFDANGDHLLSWKLGTGLAGTPEGIAIAADGTVYVTDYSLAVIEQFTSEGVLLRQIGTRGVEPGQFLAPVAVAVDPSGNLIVSDQRGNRVQKLTVP